MTIHWKVVEQYFNVVLFNFTQLLILALPGVKGLKGIRTTEYDQCNNFVLEFCKDPYSRNHTVALVKVKEIVSCFCFLTVYLINDSMVVSDMGQRTGMRFMASVLAMRYMTFDWETVKSFDPTLTRPSHTQPSTCIKSR